MTKPNLRWMAAILATVTIALIGAERSRDRKPAGARKASGEPSSVCPSATESATSGAPSSSASASGSEGASAPNAVPARVSEGPPRMLHLDPRHTNRSPFVGPSHPRVAWVFDAHAAIEAAPVMTETGTVLIATLGGKLFGIAPDDGKQRFAVDLEDRIYSTPLTTQDGVFVGSDARKFFGLGGSGEAIRFKLDTDGDADTGASPTPWGGIVFASGQIIYATTHSGTLLWRFRTRRKAFSSPAVGLDGTVFVGSQDDHLYALNPNGKARFRVALEADVDSAPAIGDDGTVFVGTDRSEIVAIAPDAGTLRWRTSVGGFVRGALSIARCGSVLAGTYGPKPSLVALDPRTGAVRFRFEIRGTSAAEFGIHGGPLEDARGRLFFGAQDDHVYALTSAGELLWKYPTQGDVDAPVVLLPNGLLLVGSDDGKVYALADDTPGVRGE